MKIQLSKSRTIFHSIAFIGCIALTATTQAQTTVKAKPVADNNINLKVYYQSASIGDVNMAINAVHYLIAGDPVKYGTWQDTLAYLYLQNNAYQQSFIMASSLIAGKGYTDLRMEIKAIAAKGLQQPTEAIDAYGTLYGKTKNPAFGFEQLQLQYGIRRLAETIVTGNSLLQALQADKKDTVMVMKADNKSAQKVTFKAAICNILGLTYIDLKDKTNAIAQFEIALKESPEFELAKNNLETAKALSDAAKKE